jgi:hypothetical protein
MFVTTPHWLLRLPRIVPLAVRAAAYKFRLDVISLAVISRVTVKSFPIVTLFALSELEAVTVVPNKFKALILLVATTLLAFTVSIFTKSVFVTYPPDPSSTILGDKTC